MKLFSHCEFLFILKIHISHHPILLGLLHPHLYLHLKVQIPSVNADMEDAV